jgi:hypothetical protein
MAFHCHCYKSTLVVLSAVVLLAIVIARVNRDRVLHPTTCERQCIAILKQLTFVVKLYKEDEGAWPRVTPEFLGSIFTRENSMYLCKCANSTPGQWANMLEWMDYAYVDWSQLFPGTNVPPNNYPVFYDRRLSNHSGDGVFVALYDGTVIWDPSASYLRSFSLGHPDYPITLPDGYSQND